jgi:hypothetical protein
MTSVCMGLMVSVYSTEDSCLIPSLIACVLYSCGPLTCLQQLACHSYHRPYACSIYTYIQSVEVYFNIVLTPIRVCVCSGHFSSVFLTNILYSFHTSPK